MASAVACTTDAGIDPSFDTPTSTAGDDGTTPIDSSTGVADSSSSGDEAPLPDTGDSTDSGSSGDAGGQLCGDGERSGTEQCDCGGEPCAEAELEGTACADIVDPFGVVYTGGLIGCNPASCKFDPAMCTRCGDGIINGIEACDGDMPGPLTCAGLGRGTLGEVTCGSDCKFDTSACTSCGYLFDFSSCGDWTVGRTEPSAANPSWECGDPTGDPPYGPPDEFEGAWATRIDGFYSANESSFLRSPPLDFSRCAGETLTMTLTHWFNFESLAVNADGGIVQVSADGETWTTVEPTSGVGYGTLPIVATFPPVDGATGFDGTLTADNAASAQTSEFDLSDFAGESGVYVRFVFGSDGSSVTAGWYIDSVNIIGGGGG